MRSPLARISRARFAVLLAASVSVLLTPTRALATHWVVDQSGGGDFTTIQAAIDQRVIEFRDSILVLPGEYAETLVLPPVPQRAFLVGMMGAAFTRVQTVTVTATWGQGSTNHVEGLTITNAVSFGADASRCYFKSCDFRAAVDAYGGSGGEANLEDCDFYGRTTIFGYLGYRPPSSVEATYPPFRRLRFHSAPLTMGTDGTGPCALKECMFEGPADTLLLALGGNDPVTLDDCVFKNARIGIVYPWGSIYPDHIARCVFDNLADFGVLLESSYTGSAPYGIGVSDSRFNRCGTAIRWMPHGWAGNGGFALVRDTILASTHDGIQVGQISATLDSLIVDGSGGRGAAFLQGIGGPVFGFPGMVAITGSTFVRNGGDGVYADASGRTLVGQNTMRYMVTGCTFALNDSTGLRVLGVLADVRDNLSFANGGDGIAFSTSSPEWRSHFESNSSVLNRGDGLSLETPYPVGESQALVQHNLAALNAGTGFRVPHASFGSFAFNDAWNNYQSQYVGAWSSADSNLTVDPRFCDLGAGNLGLQQGSPAGAGGIYGLIGALPEQCPNTTVVEPAAPRLSFAVRPTVARGSVEFVPPSIGPDGRVEIFDVTGRRLWSAAFGPTTGPLSWKGRSDTGHAQPGLYWVRFTRAGETQSQRLVWLR